MSYHCTATEVRHTIMKYCERSVSARKVEGKSTCTSWAASGTVVVTVPDATRVDGANDAFVI